MKTIIDLRNDLDNNVVTSEELFNEANLKAHKYQEEYNSFVTTLLSKSVLKSIIVFIIPPP